MKKNNYLLLLLTVSGFMVTLNELKAQSNYSYTLNKYTQCIIGCNNNVNCIKNCQSIYDDSSSKPEKFKGKNKK